MLFKLRTDAVSIKKNKAETIEDILDISKINPSDYLNHVEAVTIKKAIELILGYIKFLKNIGVMKRSDSQK